MAKNKKALKKNKKIPGKKFVGKKTFRKKPAGKKPVKKLVKKPLKKTQARVVKKAPVKKEFNAFTENMRKVALKVLDDRQAEDIVTVDLTGKSSMADYLIVASGRANRQVVAIAHYLREAFEKLGIKPVRVEGMREGNWVLVDGGDVIVHLFRPEVRRYYNIESIWDRK